MSYFSYEKALFTPASTYSRLPIKETQVKKTEPVTSNCFFKIVIILDESGSMETVKESMRSSINDLIKEQQQIKGRPATFTLVKFSDKVKRTIQNKPLESINLLTSEDYSPNGSTALYDAIGDTIDWFRNEKDVLMVIVTDGQENASRSFSKREVTRMIEDRKKYDNWTYVYLSCDLNTAAQGDAIGLDSSYECTNAVVKQAHFGDYISRGLNTAIKNYRTDGLSVQQQLNTK